MYFKIIMVTLIQILYILYLNLGSLPKRPEGSGKLGVGGQTNLYIFQGERKMSSEDFFVEGGGAGGCLSYFTKFERTPKIGGGRHYFLLFKSAACARKILLFLPLFSLYIWHHLLLRSIFRAQMSFLACYIFAHGGQIFKKRDFSPQR